MDFEIRGIPLLEVANSPIPPRNLSYSLYSDKKIAGVRIKIGSNYRVAPDDLDSYINKKKKLGAWFNLVPNSQS